MEKHSNRWWAHLEKARRFNVHTGQSTLKADVFERLLGWCIPFAGEWNAALDMIDTIQDHSSVSTQMLRKIANDLAHCEANDPDVDEEPSLEAARELQDLEQQLKIELNKVLAGVANMEELQAELDDIEPEFLKMFGRT